MPQRWQTFWKAPTAGTPEDRTQRIDTLGNLTLLTAKLNESVSNGPWQEQDDERGKCVALKEHDVLLINRDLDSYCQDDDWTDQSIDARTQKLVERIKEIWPVPPGHKVSTVRTASPVFHSVDLADLLSDGRLSVGQAIFPRDRTLRHRTGRVLSDGRIELEEKVFDTPSGAGHYLRKRATNGWSFWLVDVETSKSLASLRREYLEKSATGESLVVEDEDDSDDAEGDGAPYRADAAETRILDRLQGVDGRSLEHRLQKAAAAAMDLDHNRPSQGFTLSAVISTGIF